MRSHYAGPMVIARPSPWLALGVVLLALTTASCGDPTSTDDGTLHVSVVSTGGDSGPQNYVLVVGTLDPRPVTSNDQASYPLPGGSYDVRLLAVPAYCRVEGEAERHIDVTAGETTDITFEVDCGTTGILITTATTGTDLDVDGYRVAISGVDENGIQVTGTDSMPVGSNDTMTVSGLTPGEYRLLLAGLAPNCSQSFAGAAVSRGVVTPVTVTVECTATTGVVAVTFEASGSDIEVGLNSVRIDDQHSGAALLPGQTTYVSQVPLGSHAVGLDSDRGNCSPVGDPPAITLRGLLVRDTASVTLTARCLAQPVFRITAPTTGRAPVPHYGVSVELPPDFELTTVPFFISIGDLAAGETLVIPDTYSPPGQLGLRLDHVPSGCAVTGDNPRQWFTLAFGDTVDVAFPVTCSGP
jgi:hypothetical protein